MIRQTELDIGERNRHNPPRARVARTLGVPLPAMTARAVAPITERKAVGQIHPTAVVDPRAQLGRDVVIGPFCVVEAGTIIGDGCRLEARAVVKSRSMLGCDNEI